MTGGPAGWRYAATFAEANRAATAIVAHARAERRDGAAHSLEITTAVSEYLRSAAVDADGSQTVAVAVVVAAVARRAVMLPVDRRSAREVLAPGPGRTAPARPPGAGERAQP